MTTHKQVREFVLEFLALCLIEKPTLTMVIPNES